MKFRDTKYGDLTGQTYEGNINASDLGLTSLEGISYFKRIISDFSKLEVDDYMKEVFYLILSFITI